MLVLKHLVRDLQFLELPHDQLLLDRITHNELVYDNVFVLTDSVRPSDGLFFGGRIPLWAENYDALRRLQIKPDSPYFDRHQQHVDVFVRTELLAYLVAILRLTDAPVYSSVADI